LRSEDSVDGGGGQEQPLLSSVPASAARDDWTGEKDETRGASLDVEEVGFLFVSRCFGER